MVKHIKDFPQKGINFIDITPTLLDIQETTNIMIQMMAWPIWNSNCVVVSPEARGFIFGSLAAFWKILPFFMLRKKGKLPDDGTQISFTAEKEYGSSEFVVNESDLQLLKDKNYTEVIIVDDIIATGKTDLAIAEFFKSKGFKVNNICSMIEIQDLKGRELLEKSGYNILSVIQE